MTGENWTFVYLSFEIENLWLLLCASYVHDVVGCLSEHIYCLVTGTPTLFWCLAVWLLKAGGLFAIYCYC